MKILCLILILLFNIIIISSEVEIIGYNIPDETYDYEIIVEKIREKDEFDDYEIEIEKIREKDEFDDYEIIVEEIKFYFK